MHAWRGSYSVPGMRRPAPAAASSICRASRGLRIGLDVFGGVCSEEAARCCGDFFESRR